jgi:hypothetical protein
MKQALHGTPPEEVGRFDQMMYSIRLLLVRTIRCHSRGLEVDVA